jgi:hypothetical protein
LYDGTAGGPAGRTGAFNGAPQLSQNASPGIAVAPHCGQITAPELLDTAGAATAGAIGAAGCNAATGATGMSAAPH